MNKMHWMTLQPLFAPEGEGGGAGGGADTQAGGGADTAAGGAGADTVTGGGAPGPKWWEGQKFADPARQFLTAKGLTVDDPMDAMVKLADIASNAEKRIGRGVDTIIDKPAKDQPYGDWARANAAALGLPDKEEGYAVKPPEFWPKDMPWDAALEAKGRALAFKNGMTPTAYQEFVGLQAQAMLDLDKASKEGFAKANSDMMADLNRDYGNQTGAVITRAKQAAQFVAEKAGLSAEGLGSISQLLSEKTGDAQTIRLFAAIGDLMGEDAAVGFGKGGGLGTTPAEARSELARLRAPEGDYAKAVAKNDRNALSTLGPRIEQLTKIVAQG